MAYDGDPPRTELEILQELAELFGDLTENAEQFMEGLKGDPTPRKTWVLSQEILAQMWDVHAEWLEHCEERSEIH